MGADNTPFGSYDIKPSKGLPLDFSQFSSDFARMGLGGSIFSSYISCEVYSCSQKFSSVTELDEHMKAEHASLLESGVSSPVESVEMPENTMENNSTVPGNLPENNVQITSVPDNSPKNNIQITSLDIFINEIVASSPEVFQDSAVQSPVPENHNSIVQDNSPENNIPTPEASTSSPSTPEYCTADEVTIVPPPEQHSPRLVVLREPTPMIEFINVTPPPRVGIVNSY